MEPSWPDILDAAISRRLRGVHTAIPAVVRSYDPATQTAEVAPVVQIEVAADTWIEPPPIPGVPVLQPRGGGFFAHFPVTAGDAVLLIFSEQDPSTWLGKGGSSAERPAFVRRHGFYPFAVLGAAPRSAPLADAVADALVIGQDGGDTITFDGAGIMLGAPTAVDLVATETRILTALSAIFAAGVNGAVPGTDGGKAAFTAAQTAIASQAVGSPKIKAP